MGTAEPTSSQHCPLVPWLALGLAPGSQGLQVGLGGILVNWGARKAPWLPKSGDIFPSPAPCFISGVRPLCPAGPQNYQPGGLADKSEMLWMMEILDITLILRSLSLTGPNFPRKRVD